MTAPDAFSPAYRRIAEMAIGVRIALALRVAVERRIPDLIGDSPKTAEVLSRGTGFPADTLRRLLRGLADCGVFEESLNGEFSNTEFSTYLCDGASPSLREMVLVLNDDAVVRGWQQLPQVLESGAPAFAKANGMAFFEYVASDSKRSELMGKFMAGIYEPEAPKIAASYPFGSFRSLIDIGGGQGHVLMDIMQQHPNLKGALFDLPSTAELAREFLAAKGFAGCDVLSGDFFQAVPSGFDVYFIKSVLHDWDDERSTQILRSCREAMPEHGRLLIADLVVERGKPVRHPHRLIDLEMMVSFGGKERTADEFEKLLHGAGLKLEQSTAVQNSFFSLIEASRAH
jgi:hypothetical protein